MKVLNMTSMSGITRSVAVIAQFEKFEELKSATLEYVLEIERTHKHYQSQIPLQIDPWRNNIWDSVGFSKPGMLETDYSTILPRFKNSIFEELIMSMPTPVCRARIMRMRDTGLYPTNADKYARIHIPIISMPTGLDTIEANGDIYWVDAKNCHKFVNSGQEPRIHIMMSIVDNTYKPT